MTEIPAEAVTAAAVLIHNEECNDGNTETCGRWRCGSDPASRFYSLHARHVEFYCGKAREILAVAAPYITAAERERIRPLVQALADLYDVVWNKTATLESDVPGYNLISYDDTNAIDEAGGTIEELLASGAIADLLGGES